MEEEFTALLLADTSLTAIVSTRIHWNEAPQGTANPNVILRVISSSDSLHMNGKNDLLEARIQVDCYGTSYSQAKSISRAIQSTLHGFRSGGFLLIQDGGQTDLGSKEEHSGGLRVHLINHDFLIHWRN